MILVRNRLIIVFMMFVISSINTIIAKPLIQVIFTYGGGLTIQLAPGCKFLCSDKKRNEMISKIMNNPETILKDNLDILYIGHPSINETDSILVAFDKLAQVNPVWLLAECIGMECSLSRLRNPKIRNNFEDTALQHINTYYPNKNELLVYTSFASGNLFSDFIMLTKIIESGYKNIHINFIDLKFDTLVKAVYGKKNHIFKIDDLMVTQLTEELITAYQLTQLLSWLKTYKNVSLTMHAYPSMDSYNKDCINNEQLKASALFAIDWMEDVNQSTITDIRYTGPVKTLKNNGLFFILNADCLDGTFLLKKSNMVPSIDTFSDVDLKRYFVELKVDKTIIT